MIFYEFLLFGIQVHKISQTLNCMFSYVLYTSAGKPQSTAIVSRHLKMAMCCFGLGHVHKNLGLGFE